MSIGLQGLKGEPIRVEADIRNDKEQCVIIGLPDASIKESKERILSCLHHLDFDLTMKKITIHLSPADIRKSGTGFDGAILLAAIQELTDQPLHWMIPYVSLRLCRCTGNSFLFMACCRPFSKR